MISIRYVSCRSSFVSEWALVFQLRLPSTTWLARSQQSSNSSLDKAQPSLFSEPKPSDPPADLSPDAIRSVVLASASSFPATESALRAVNDCPVPDASQSAALISQMERMKAIEATQIAQAAELAELRTKSEEVVRAWYEGSALVASEFLADMESRTSVVERAVRRAERASAEAQAL